MGYQFRPHQSVRETLRRMRQEARADGRPMPFRARAVSREDGGTDYYPDPHGDVIVLLPRPLDARVDSPPLT